VTRPNVLGIELDPQTRCAHWRSPLDVIAIKMRCCGEYYACRQCHDELADHPARIWPPEEWDLPAILCGVCDSELTVRQYLDCGNACPACQARFNPGCRNHSHLYFARTVSDGPSEAAT
jgi:uncharacterized CHY-type Zn-finger protein